MPGGSAYEKDLLKALRAGEIDLKALRRCCGNVVRAVMASRTQREYIHK